MSDRFMLLKEDKDFEAGVIVWSMSHVYLGKYWF